jgi:hypothetical protein
MDVAVDHAEIVGDEAAVEHIRSEGDGQEIPAAGMESRKRVSRKRVFTHRRARCDLLLEPIDYIFNHGRRAEIVA